MAASSDTKGDGMISGKNRDKFPIGDALNKYLPYVGGASTIAFSLNIMNPRIYRGMFSPYDLSVTNCMWFNAHLGTGLYLYNRPIISQAPTQKRIAYSVFGAMIFNFGTVLFWATTKTLLPKNNVLRCIFGMASGAAMLYLGKDYLNFIDSHLALE